MDTRSQRPIRWGIYGAGAMGTVFAKALLTDPLSILEGVASRQPATAQKLSAECNNPTVHANLQELIDNPSIDIIYIATQNHLHFENAMQCLQQRKPVLLEKPLTINFAGTQILVKKAQESKTFFMEALWTRFLPFRKMLDDILQEKILGEIVHISSSFGMQFEFQPQHRVFSKERGGGALLDLGIYPLNMAHMVLGMPATIDGHVLRGATDVDVLNVLNLRYSNGAIASVKSSIVSELENETFIAGTKGYLRILGAPCNPTAVELNQNVIFKNTDAFNHRHEALEANRCLRDGLLQSPLMPHSVSLEISELLDKASQTWREIP